MEGDKQTPVNIKEVTVAAKKLPPKVANDSINYMQTKGNMGTNTNREEFEKKYADEIQKHIDSGVDPNQAYMNVVNAKNGERLGLAKKTSFYSVFNRK